MDKKKSNKKMEKNKNFFLIRICHVGIVIDQEMSRNENRREKKFFAANIFRNGNRSAADMK